MSYFHFDQDDQNNEAADLRTTPLKEIEPHSPGDKQETVAEEEALPTQVLNKALYIKPSSLIFRP